MSEGWRYFLDFKGQTFELQDGEQTVGRSRTCEVSVNDPSVSRRHVVLTADSSRILLKDLGSSNGTFINGDRVQESGELHHGDTLGLGDADVTVRVVGTSAFETVRMSAHPLEKPHGDATLFLQEASAQLAQEAMDLGEEAPASSPSHMAPPPIQPPEESPTGLSEPAAPQPGAPQPAAPQPGAPQPGAPQPAAPSHMAPPPIQPAPVTPPSEAPAAPPAMPDLPPAPATLWRWQRPAGHKGTSNAGCNRRQPYGSACTAITMS